MTFQNWLDMLPSILIGGFVLFFLWQLTKNKTLEFSDFQKATELAKPLAEKIAPAAKMAVMAAEEYGRTGKLITSDEKLKYAIETFYKLTPDHLEVPLDVAMAAIHSFIPIANSFGANIIIQEGEGDEQTSIHVEPSASASE